MGVNISVTDMATTLSIITDNLGNWQGRYICVSNVHTTVMTYEDANYLAIQNNAVMALPDGGPLSKYCRDHDRKNVGRVTGPDLMQEILKLSANYGWRHYYYGST